MMEECFAYDDQLRRGGIPRGEALDSARNAVTVLAIPAGSISTVNSPTRSTRWSRPRAAAPRSSVSSAAVRAERFVERRELKPTRVKLASSLTRGVEAAGVGTPARRDAQTGF